jgi:hypothetical protein
MRRTLSLLGGVLLGASLSQFPEFSQQYAQRLGGAVDELTLMTENFDAAAAREGVTREQAFALYDNSTDTFLNEQGQDMRLVFARQARLSAHLEALEQANAFEELLSFAQYYDPQIASRAWQAFQPAVPITPEGLMFGGAGLLGGYGLVSLGTSPFARRRRTRKA